MSSLFYYFSHPIEKSALLLTKLSTISVSSFFLLVNHLTHLLQEQYPAVRLVLTLNSQSLLPSDFLSLCIGWVGGSMSYPVGSLSQLSTLRCQRQYQQVQQQCQGITLVHSVASSVVCVSVCEVVSVCTLTGKVLQ